MNVINYDEVVEDNITKNLFLLIYSYLSKDKKVDLEFVKTVLFIVNDEKKLSKYINNISIDNNLNCKGAYYNLIQDISINIDKITHEISLNDDKYSKNENKLRRYIEVTESILHEIEHGNQEKIKDTEDSLESKILVASTRNRDLIFKDIKTPYINFITYLKLKSFKAKYHKYYDCCPYERLAYIKASKKILELVRRFEYTSIIEYKKFIMLMDCLKGYSKYVSPTIYYIKKMNKGFSDWEEISDIGLGLDYEDKKILGLYLSRDELVKSYEEADEQFNKIERLLK